MVQMDEGQLEGYLSTWLANKFPHLTSPWFQAQVVTVNGDAPPYTVTLQRLGEPGPDGGEYVVAPTGYVPLPGDNVECCWRDSNTAYVMWPLSPRSAITPASAFCCTLVRAAAGTFVSGNTTLPCDQVYDDPWNMRTGRPSGNYGIRIPAAGVYLVAGQVCTNVTTATIQQQVNISGNLWTTGSSAGPTSGNWPSSAGSLMFRLKKGDVIYLSVWSSAAVALVAGVARTWLQVVKVS